MNFITGILRFVHSLSPGIVLALSLSAAMPVHAGLFLIDLAGDGPNSAGRAAGWDSINNLVQGQAFGPLTDVFGLDNDVTITALDDGFSPNNLGPPGVGATYDGIFVPSEARDDYLFKITDVPGTEARLRIDNLDAGLYTVTVFEGRTTDANQVAKLWVGNAAGSGEPANQNTGNFAGGSSTLSLTINAGDVLWYKHLEDGTGGLSGIIINPTAVPEPSALWIFALVAGCGIKNARVRRRQVS